MAADLQNERLISQYLLGDLPEELQVEIEELAFSNEDYLALITAVENDLIDEYVRNELTATERHRFESRFLTSEARRKRVNFAKTLAATEPVRQESAKSARDRGSWRDSFFALFGGLNPVAKVGFAVAALLVVVGVAWLFTETQRLRRQLNELQADNQTQQDLQRALDLERKRSEELAARLGQEQQQREQTDESLRQLTESVDATRPPPPPIIAALTLLPGITRGGAETPRLTLPEDARLVRLQIGIDPAEQYKSFDIEIRTVAGRRVWTRENLNTRSRHGTRSIGLTLPATALKPGDYELSLRGRADSGNTEDIGFYYFNVRKL